MQSIYFATSDDLLTWRKVDNLAFQIDERTYKRIEPHAMGPWEDPRRLRLLLRHTMLEFYINELLIQCYTMATPATGRVSWAGVEDTQDRHRPQVNSHGCTRMGTSVRWTG